MTHLAPHTIVADDIDSTFVAVRHPSVVEERADDGETMLLDRRTNRTHQLNQSAALVWACLDGSGSLAEISVDLAEVAAVDVNAVSDDVLALVRQLGRAGMVRGVVPEAPELQQAVQASLPQGTPLPEFSLPDLDGSTVTTGDLRGRRLLMVNWSLSCGHCLRIAPELAYHSDELAERGIELLLIGRGDPAAIRDKHEELGLSASMLVDETGEATVFTGLGTPAAYGIDADGKIATDLAYGGLHVPELARLLATGEESV